jgi:hypothetical protein
LDARHLLAVWDKAEEKNFFIVASRSDDGGKTWQPPWVLRQSSTLVSQPHVVATPFGFRVFWIEQKEQVGWSMANVQ